MKGDHIALEVEFWPTGGTICLSQSHCAMLPSDEGTAWTCPGSHKSQMPHVNSSTWNVATST